MSEHMVPSFPTIMVELEPSQGSSTDGSTGAQPQPVARLEDNWWKLGFTDGRLGRSAASAQNILQTTAASAFDDVRTKAESNVKAREAELEHVRQQIEAKKAHSDELLEFRNSQSGARQRKTNHSIIVPYFYVIAGIIALLADIALSSNLVAEGFRVKDRFMFWSMVAGFAVFGVFLKAGLNSLLKVWHEKERLVLKLFWCLSLLFVIFTLFAVSSFRGQVEVRTERSLEAQQKDVDIPVATPEENEWRSRSFIALCLSLPLVAGGLLFMGSKLIHERWTDVKALEQIDQLSADRRHLEEDLKQKSILLGEAATTLDRLQEPASRSSYVGAVVDVYKHGYERGQEVAA